MIGKKVDCRSGRMIPIDRWALWPVWRETTQSGGANQLAFHEVAWQKKVFISMDDSEAPGNRWQRRGPIRAKSQRSRAGRNWGLFYPLIKDCRVAVSKASLRYEDIVHSAGYRLSVHKHIQWLKSTFSEVFKPLDFSHILLCYSLNLKWITFQKKNYVTGLHATPHDGNVFHFFFPQMN